MSASPTNSEEDAVAAPAAPAAASAAATKPSAVDLSETIKKLKRLVTLYKKEVDRLKDTKAVIEHDLEEKDKQIAALTSTQTPLATREERFKKARPLDVVMRVQCPPLGMKWCYVKYDTEEEGYEKSGDQLDECYGWAKEPALTQQSLDFGVKLKLPTVTTADHGASNLEEVTRELAVATENVERVQEDFRRYRVRAEIIRRQKETEINKLMDSRSHIHEHQLALDSKLEHELNLTKARVRELEEEQRKMKTSSDSQKADWERLKRENGQLKQLLDSGGARGDERLAEKHQKLKQEYQAYRKRAMELLKSKGKDEKKRKDGNSEWGGPNSNTGIDQETVVYLRNTVLQYMAADREEVKEQMEGAIATVLRFEKKDLDFVHAKRQSRSWASFLGVS